uniref:(northern house mosquito) hypothetical protein n=1 Tax=Culex pipiens TaxID=7175 RepID=A0A8D8C9G4_CULPI
MHFTLIFPSSKCSCPSSNLSRATDRSYRLFTRAFLPPPDFPLPAWMAAGEGSTDPVEVELVVSERAAAAEATMASGTANSPPPPSSEFVKSPDSSSDLWRREDLVDFLLLVAATVDVLPSVLLLLLPLPEVALAAGKVRNSNLDGGCITPSG